MRTLTKRSVTIFGFMAFFAYGSNSLAEVTTVIETEYSKLYSAVKLAENKIPDATEIKRKNEAFIKWGNYFSKYIESYFEGPKELRKLAQKYRDAAATGNTESLLEIADVLERRATQLSDDLDEDQKKLATLVQNYLTALNAEGGPRFEVNVIADKINKIVVKGYGKELVTSYNMYKGDKEIKLNLFYPHESGFGLLGSGRYAYRSYVNYMENISISNKESLEYLSFPVIDIDFIRWALGNKPGQEVKIERIDVKEAAKKQSWIEWLGDIGNSDYDCPKYDNKKNTLTLYTHRVNTHVTSTRLSCVKDPTLSMAFVGSDRSEIIDLLFKMYRKYPKVAEDGSRQSN